MVVRSVDRPGESGDGESGNSLAAPDSTQPLIGRGLDSDLIRPESQGRSNDVCHFLPTRAQARPFGQDAHIHVLDIPSFGTHACGGFYEETQTGAVPPLFVAGRIVLANVTHAGGTQQGIHESMQEGIGVAVAF